MRGRYLRRALAAAICVLSCLGGLSAEEIFVNNRTYKGHAVGHGLDTEVVVHELAKALKVEPEEDNGFWKIRNIRFPARHEKGVYYTTLRDLKKAGLIIIMTPSLETIDISLPQE